MMANELSWRHTATGETLYATVRSQSRQYWNTDTPDWEALTVANWGDYAVATTETPADSFFYVGDMPSVTVGFYWIDFFERAGGSPAIGDEMVGSWLAYWDGTNLRPYDPHTGDSHEVVTDANYGNAQLVRSATPANALGVDASGNVEANNMRGTDGALTTLGVNAPSNWLNADAFATDALSGLEVDSVGMSTVMEMLIAFMNGQVSASSSEGVTTYTYYRRDGTTMSFTSVCSEVDGTRATTGNIPN